MRLLVLGERRAPIVLALLGAPTAAAGAAAGRVLAGWFHLPAAVAAPLGRRWLRVRAWASAWLLGVLRTANGRFCGTVQLFADELDNDLADELGVAQLVSDERLERLPGRRGHALSLRRRCHDAEMGECVLHWLARQKLLVCLLSLSILAP